MKRTWQSPGFTGKKHTTYSRMMMSEGRRAGWAKKRAQNTEEMKKVSEFICEHNAPGHPKVHEIYEIKELK